MRIVAIGGSVIKTAWDEIKEVASRRMFDVLIHNGGSVFHDFQRASEKLESHSYPLDDLIKDFEPNRQASEMVWGWMGHVEESIPHGSLTAICVEKEIDTLLFTGLGCDFWQIFEPFYMWAEIGLRCGRDFGKLCEYMEQPFHFVNLGSAVIMPEVFSKALAISKPRNFRADVVDFLDMYRPRTRVAKYGTYYQMEHKTYLTKVLNDEIKWRERLIYG